MAFSNGPQVKASQNSLAINNTGTGSPISVTLQQSLNSLPSILNPLLDGIITVYEPQYEEASGLFIDPDIEVKISFNSVRAYAEDIREQSCYMSLIEEVLDNIDNEKPKAKEKFLWAINKKYRDCKKALFIENNTDTSNRNDVLKVISDNADNIINRVSRSIIDNSIGYVSAPIELVEAAQELIVCFGFINCQILEKPE